MIAMSAAMFAIAVSGFASVGGYGLFAWTEGGKHGPQLLLFGVTGSLCALAVFLWVNVPSAALLEPTP